LDEVSLGLRGFVRDGRMGRPVLIGVGGMGRDGEDWSLSRLEWIKTAIEGGLPRGGGDAISKG
jgi:hypothetical protein